MTGDVVVDASVVLKWFRSGEARAAEAVKLRERHLDGEITLCAPLLLIYEVVNALRFKPDLSPDDVVEADASLRELELEFFSPTHDVLSRAVQISTDYRDVQGKSPSIYDSCYLALAELLQCPMVTADGQLLLRVAGHPQAVSLADI